MSGVPQKLYSLANSSASRQYKEESKKRRIRNKGAYISRSAKSNYVSSLEKQVSKNDVEIKNKKKTIAKTAAEIEDLRNTEMRTLGQLLFRDK